MEIQHLREFTYLAETLNFGITAKHFFISTSVLSKHISAMESTLGVRLFERDRHGVELTKAGEKFYGNIVTVLTDFDHALESVSPGSNHERKSLRVGYLRGAARPFLGKFVEYFEQHCPNISLEITCMEYSELLYAHRSHAVDALLDMELDPEAPLACDSEPIYKDKTYVVVGKAHPLASHDGPLFVKDLEGLAAVLPDLVAYPGYAQHCERIVRAAGEVNVCHRYKDVDTFFFRLSGNDCFGFSSGHNAAQYNDQCVFVPLADIDTSYDVTARWLRVTDPEVVDSLKAAAKSCAAYMAGWSDGVC